MRSPTRDRTSEVCPGCRSLRFDECREERRAYAPGAQTLLPGTPPPHRPEHSWGSSGQECPKVPTQGPQVTNVLEHLQEEVGRVPPPEKGLFHTGGFHVQVVDRVPSPDRPPLVPETRLGEKSGVGRSSDRLGVPTRLPPRSLTGHRTSLSSGDPTTGLPHPDPVCPYTALGQPVQYKKSFVLTAVSLHFYVGPAQVDARVSRSGPPGPLLGFRT